MIFLIFIVTKLKQNSIKMTKHNKNAIAILALSLIAQKKKKSPKNIKT